MRPTLLPRLRYGVLTVLLSLAASSASAQVLAADPAQNGMLPARPDSAQGTEDEASLSRGIFDRAPYLAQLHDGGERLDGSPLAPSARAQGGAGRGALFGAAIGGAVALAIVGVVGAEYGWGCPTDECFVTPTGTATLLSLPLPLIGAGIGALVGLDR